MAGSPVDRQLLDAKMSEAVVSVRRALRQVETIQNYLVNHPVQNPDNPETKVDPLMAEFGYDADEAYLIRLVFGDLDYAGRNLSTTMTNGRKLTGLE